MDESVTQNILERMVRIETLIETKMNNTDARIDKLESNLQWLWRAVVGAVIGAAIGFYFKI